MDFEKGYIFSYQSKLSTFFRFLECVLNFNMISNTTDRYLCQKSF